MHQLQGIKMVCPFCAQEHIQALCPSCGWSLDDHIDTDATYSEFPIYEMLPISGQEFWMGSSVSEKGRDNDENLHLVKLSRSFQIGRTEVSQELYEQIMGENPSFFQKPQHPIENISWESAIQFCNQYSTLCNREPAYLSKEGELHCNFDADGFRLPTEAEWELCAKIFSVKQNDVQNVQIQTSPVESEPKSKISALDGNVWEYCWDWYAPYPTERTTDPIGPKNGTYRVIRGGSWVDTQRIRRPENRAFTLPTQSSETIGFRLVSTIK